MNSDIETMFNNFIVDNVQIPVSFLVYTGDSEVFITYASLGETPSFFYDNDVGSSTNTYDFNIYTKGNYVNILKKVKELLKANGWNWIEDSGDIYEDDTRYFHKVTTWSKERIDY